MMSLFPYHPSLHMVKHCFAPCPANMPCECRERLYWECSYEGREWKREQAELIAKQRQQVQDYKNFKDLFEGL